MKDLLLMVCTPLVMITASGLAAVAPEGEHQAGRVGLVEEKAIFELSADTDVRENRGVGTMKLSPDGTKLLFLRRRPVKQRPGARSRPTSRPTRAYDLVVRDLATKKDKVLKIPAYTWDDIPVMMIAMNVFDATGKRVALGIGVDANKNGLHDHREGKEKLQAALYDLATDKVTRIDVTADVVLPTFDASRKGLIIVAADMAARSGKMYTTPADKIKLRQLSIWGLPRGPCPGTDLLALLLPPDRQGGRALQAGFVLLDLAKGKVVAKLPVRGRNTKLDDYSPQWTANGQYLYYIGVDTEPGPDGRPRPKYETRIWDRKKGQLVGDIPRTVAIGPGPTKTSMVLTPHAGPGGLIVHDAAAGKLWQVADEPVRPISIQGKYILYVKRGKNGKAVLYRGRIELPK